MRHEVTPSARCLSLCLTVDHQFKCFLHLQLWNSIHAGGPWRTREGASGCVEGVTSQHPPAPLLFISIGGHHRVLQRSAGHTARSLSFSLQSEEAVTELFNSVTGPAFTHLYQSQSPWQLIIICKLIDAVWRMTSPCVKACHYKHPEKKVPLYLVSDSSCVCPDVTWNASEIQDNTLITPSQLAAVLVISHSSITPF